MEERQYVGLDVSQTLTSICVLSEAGSVVWRGNTCSEPDAIAAAIREHAQNIVRIGLETGSLYFASTRSEGRLC